MHFKLIAFCLIITCLLAPFHTLAQTTQTLPSDLEVITPENAHRLVEVGRIGNGQALYATWSPDGNRIAVASTVGVWMVSLSEPPRLLEGHRGLALHVAFSDDGLLMAAGDQHGTVYLWHGISGELLTRFQSDLGEIAKLEFSPDRTFIALIDDVGSVNVRNIATNEIVFEQEAEEVLGSRDLIFSPDGKYLAWIVSYYCCDFVEPWYFVGAGAWRLLDMQTFQQLPVPEWYLQQYDATTSGSTLVFDATGKALILTVDSENNQTLQDFWTGEITELTENLIGFDMFESHAYRDRPHLSVENGISIRLYSDGTNLFAVVPYAWTPSITYMTLAMARSGEGTSIPDTYSLITIYETSRLELKEIDSQGISGWWGEGIQGTATAVATKGYRGNADVIVGTLNGTVLYSHGQGDFQILEGHTAAVTELAFLQSDDPFDRNFVSNAQDGTIRLWKYNDEIRNFESEILYQTEHDLRNLRYDLHQNRLLFTEYDRRCTNWCVQIINYDLDTV